MQNIRMTVNGMLVSLNSFFRFTGRETCRVRQLRVQRKVFRDESRELKGQEYRKRSLKRRLAKNPKVCENHLTGGPHGSKFNNQL